MPTPAIQGQIDRHTHQRHATDRRREHLLKSRKWSAKRRRRFKSHSRDFIHHLIARLRLLRIPPFHQ